MMGCPCPWHFAAWVVAVLAALAGTGAFGLWLARARGWIAKRHHKHNHDCCCSKEGEHEDARPDR